MKVLRLLLSSANWKTNHESTADVIELFAQIELYRREIEEQAGFALQSIDNERTEKSILVALKRLADKELSNARYKVYWVTLLNLFNAFVKSNLYHPNCLLATSILKRYLVIDSECPKTIAHAKLSGAEINIIDKASKKLQRHIKEVKEKEQSEWRATCRSRQEIEQRYLQSYPNPYGDLGNVISDFASKVENNARALRSLLANEFHN